MLERVALGQTRFRVPGVAPDARGVLVGRRMVLTFSTIEGVVTWLRMYSAEESIDDLGNDLAIETARTQLGTQIFVVTLPVVSSYAADVAARFSRLAGGRCYTGTTLHFVRFRDEKSPYGYDAVEISPAADKSDYVLHDATFEQTLAVESTLDLLGLLHNLSPRLVAGAKLSDLTEVLMVVREGVAEGVIRYLYRNEQNATVALVAPRQDSSFVDYGRYLLVQLHRAETRILELFEAVPGIDLFERVSPRAAVQFGYRHPVRLDSCENVFTENGLSLFWGSQRRVDNLAELGNFAEVADLAQADISNAPLLVAHTADSSLETIRVPLRLGPATDVATQVAGALIPLNMASKLKQVAYFLPGSQLREYRIAATDQGFIVTHEPTTEPFPLGTLLWEFSPGVLLPLGQELLPRVSASVAARFLGHEQNLLTIFTHGGFRFQLESAQLQTFEHAAIAQLKVEQTTALDLAVGDFPAVEVRNDDISRFALWGVDDPNNSKLLPEKTGDD